MSAAGVTVSATPILGAGPGSTPRAALQHIQVKPIAKGVARQIMVRHHYLHSLPGGTYLAFGTFVGTRLLGAVSLGVGPFNSPSLVARAEADDCLTLTRLWVSDDLPKNSESKILGIVLRNLRRYTDLKFVLTYADPTQGHLGTIYQATNWIYTGLSNPTPLYDLGDGRLRHCRSVSASLGTRSVRHLSDNGVPIRLVPQAAKHRYIYFIDPSWRPQLRVSVLPYPKREATDAGP